MGIPRRYRSNNTDKENMACNRESRPWDNDTSLKLLPPVSRTVAETRTEFESNSNRLEDFKMAPVSVLDRMRVFEAAAFDQQPKKDHGLPTRIGNREVKPMLDSPRAPPLVGLPIPQQLPKKNPPSSQLFSTTLSRENTTSGSSDGNKSITLKLLEPLPQPFSASSSSTEITASDSKTSSKKSCEIQIDTPPGPESLNRIPEHLISPPLPSQRSPSSEFRRKSRKSRQSIRVAAPPPPAPTNVGLEDPDLMPRFSFRHSVRLPQDPVSGLEALAAAPRSSFRHSRRIGEAANNLSFLPQSSSFLDFNEDSRLSPLDDDTSDCTKNKDSENSIWKDMSFDEVDSFDTFGSIPEDIAPKKAPPALPQPPDGALRLESNQSEQPAFPAMSFNKKLSSVSRKPDRQPEQKSREEEEDGALDVPVKIARRPDAEGAFRDLQRASITAGKEIAASLRMEAMQVKAEEKADADNVSRVQGDILLKTRILRRWNLRYASIVHQGYFGAVLLLFRPESKGSSLGSVTLRNSKMIALTESIVRKLESNRKNSSRFMFELKTSQRTYTFGCNDSEGRDFWISSLVRHGVRFEDS